MTKEPIMSQARRGLQALFPDRGPALHALERCTGSDKTCPARTAWGL